jgi:hypothetical protein
MLQKHTGRGPCLTAARKQIVVRIHDVADDGRWEEFRDAATQSGVGSMLCLPLHVDEEVMGTLSLYSATTRAFRDGDSEPVARLLAAVALAETRRTASEYLRCVLDQLHLRHAAVIDAHARAAGPYQGLTATVVLSPSRRADAGRVEGGWHEELGWWATSLPTRPPRSPTRGSSRQPAVAPIGYLAAPGTAPRSTTQASRRCRYLTTTLAPGPDRVADFLLDSRVLGGDTPMLHRYRLIGGDSDLLALLTRVNESAEQSVRVR